MGPPTISIHALLAESDICHSGCPPEGPYFYPRSPCGERPPRCRQHLRARRFLSTLSLRRATARQCGQVGVVEISIHALLAESDPYGAAEEQDEKISIHALLAESDHCAPQSWCKRKEFLSTLSLRRATLRSCPPWLLRRRFLSTLSLRRATLYGLGREV